jgi:hypothetical protein
MSGILSVIEDVMIPWFVVLAFGEVDMARSIGMLVSFDMDQ